MTTGQCWRVCRRLAAAAALWVLAAAPRDADAAPILHEFFATPAAGITTFNGAFENANDIAVFRFTIGEDPFHFTARTDSIAVGGFDPYLTLYFGTERLTYIDETGAPTAAEADDSDLGFDAVLSLILTLPGQYTLALAHSQNFSHEAFGFDWDDSEDVIADFYGGAVCDPGGPSFGPFCSSPSFSLALQIDPVSSAPVPEPGTLSLVALGSAGAAWMRRRRARRQASRP